MINQTPTSTSTTLCEEIKFGPCEWPAVIHRNAEPKSCQAMCSGSLSMHGPYGMKLIHYFLHLCTCRDKGFGIVELLSAARFETTRIMENKSWVTFEHHLVVYIMQSTLVTFRLWLLNNWETYIGGRPQKRRLLDLFRRESLSRAAALLMRWADNTPFFR